MYTIPYQATCCNIHGRLQKHAEICYSDHDSRSLPVQKHAAIYTEEEEDVHGRFTIQKLNGSRAQFQYKNSMGASRGSEQRKSPRFPATMTQRKRAEHDGWEQSLISSDDVHRGREQRKRARFPVTYT